MTQVLILPSLGSTSIIFCFVFIHSHVLEKGNCRKKKIFRFRHSDSPCASPFYLHTSAGFYRTSAFYLSRNYPPTVRRRRLRLWYVVFILSNAAIESNGIKAFACNHDFLSVRSPACPYTNKQVLTTQYCWPKEFQNEKKESMAQNSNVRNCVSYFSCGLCFFPLGKHSVDGYTVFCGDPKCFFPFNLVWMLKVHEANPKRNAWKMCWCIISVAEGKLCFPHLVNFYNHLYHFRPSNGGYTLDITGSSVKMHNIFHLSQHCCTNNVGWVQVEKTASYIVGSMLLCTSWQYWVNDLLS